MEVGRIPVSVITGFLGSGKTTLLNQLVHHPHMDETAVIVNEFGEIGLDHELIETSDEHTILLSSGCLCCTVRGDLVDTLGSLSVRRLKGEVPRFNRVVIETTGLADPAPILHTLMSAPVATRYRLDIVVTTVDAVNGSETIAAHREAVKQVAIADRLLITKTDLSDAQAVEQLTCTLHTLNPAAPASTVVNGVIDPTELFSGAPYFDLASKSDDVRAWLRAESYDHRPDPHAPAGHHHDVNRHNDSIQAFCMGFDEALDWDTVAFWLDSLVAAHGEKLLRVKGLLDIKGVPELVVVHAVQHLFHPPMRVTASPGSRRQSRIVFITSDLARSDIESALDKAIEMVRLRTPARSATGQAFTSTSERESAND